MMKFNVLVLALALSAPAMAKEGLPPAAMLCPEDTTCSFCFFADKEMLCWNTSISLGKGVGDKTLPVSDPIIIDLSKAIKDF